ncbi:MAG: 30S ribosome-binding factor RbfA [Clostridiales bacterium]|nr:30S ribosome-binding factor RbfA [Clostridiales bacterium]
MRKNSIKNNRINNEVKKELSRIIEIELHDPRIKPMTSVVHVEVAPDLKTSKVYVSVFGNDDEKQSTIEGLNSAAPYIRSLIAKNVNLRNTPELKFILDESIEYGVSISKKIDDIIKEQAD